MISLRIDVSKIDKARLFKGEKGTYLDCVLIETPAAKYGKDWMIVESVSKEEREAGHRATSRTILTCARWLSRGQRRSS